MNMKKFMKKFAAVSMAVVMTVAFAGCGNDSGTSTGDGTAKFVIGGIGPTTGGAAVYGQAVKNAAEMAAEEINAAGGINGYQIEFKWQDDEHDTEKAVNAYNSLKDDGMQMLMGTVTSAPCTAVVALTEEDNMFQLTPSGSAVESIKGDNAFRVCFSDPNQGVGSADYFAENFPNAKVGVVYNSSDVYSNGIFKTFKKEAAAKGVNVVATEAFTKDSAQDFTVQIQKMKEAGADLVFLPFYAQEASLFLTQADKAGLVGQFFGCDGLDGVIDQLGSNAQLAEGVMLLTPYAADSAFLMTLTTACATPPLTAKPRPSALALLKLSFGSSGRSSKLICLASNMPISSSNVRTKSTSLRTLWRLASSFFAAQGPTKQIRAAG